MCLKTMEKINKGKDKKHGIDKITNNLEDKNSCGVTSFCSSNPPQTHHVTFPKKLKKIDSQIIVVQVLGPNGV